MGSGGADCPGRGEDPGVREVGRDVEDLNQPTPHPSQIIDLTDDSDDVMPDSLGSSVESIQDFGEEEQARNEEGETVEAEVH